MRTRTAPRRRALHRLASGLSGERTALVRCAAGVLLLARPRTMAAVLDAGPALVPGADWLARMFGARELALGAGVLVAFARALH